MATGISAEAVVVLMVSTEKQRGQLAVFVGWTCSHCFGGHLWSLGFHKKGQVGGSHLWLLAQSLCEIHCQFVYPIQNRLCLGEKCLFVVQSLIKIRISSSVFINRLCMLFFLNSLFICLCDFDYSVYVYGKHPLSREAWQGGGMVWQLLQASQRRLLLLLQHWWWWLLLLLWSSNSPKSKTAVVVGFVFSRNSRRAKFITPGWPSIWE